MSRRRNRQAVWSSYVLLTLLLLFAARAAADVWTYIPYRLKLTEARFFYLEKPLSDTEIRVFGAEKLGRDWKKTTLVRTMHTDADGNLSLAKLPTGKYFFDFSAAGEYGFSLLWDLRGGNKNRMLVKLRPQRMCESFFDIVPEQTKEATP